MPYTTATPGTAELQSNGSYRLPVSFSGTGVPVILESAMITGSTTPASLKAWAIGIQAALNAAKSVVDLPAIVNKTPIDLTPDAPDAATVAGLAWGAKIRALEVSQRRLARWTALGITPSGALATAITALQTSITSQGASITSDYNAADGPTRTAMQSQL